MKKRIIAGLLLLTGAWIWAEDTTDSGPADPTVAENTISEPESPLDLKISAIGGLGFSSIYGGAQIGLDYEFNELVTQLEQRFLYGISFGEITATTCIGFEILPSLAFRCGIAYLLYHPEELAPSFEVNILPTTGISYVWEISSSFAIRADLDFFQSFYIPAGLQENFTDLPFIVCCALFCSLEWKDSLL